MERCEASAMLNAGFCVAKVVKTFDRFGRFGDAAESLDDFRYNDFRYNDFRYSEFRYTMLHCVAFGLPV